MWWAKAAEKAADPVAGREMDGGDGLVGFGLANAEAQEAWLGMKKMGTKKKKRKD